MLREILIARNEIGISTTPKSAYTAAAYLVVFVGVLVYVLIISSKLQRLQRQVAQIVEELRERIPELDEREREREREREPELERG